jgi:hypothetical protein
MRALPDAARAASDAGLTFESYPPAVYNSQAGHDFDKMWVEVLAEIAPIATEASLGYEFGAYSVEMTVQSRIGIHHAAVVVK